jgi:hypothetical protein
LVEGHARRLTEQGEEMLIGICFFTVPPFFDAARSSRSCVTYFRPRRVLIARQSAPKPSSARPDGSGMGKKRSASSSGTGAGSPET